jgi:hypothetical protein
MDSSCTTCCKRCASSRLHAGVLGARVAVRPLLPQLSMFFSRWLLFMLAHDSSYKCCASSCCMQQRLVRVFLCALLLS